VTVTSTSRRAGGGAARGTAGTPAAAGLAGAIARLNSGGAPTAGQSLHSAGLPVQRVDPIAVYTAAVEADLEVALWLRPSEGFALVGIGRAWSVEPSDPGRFRDAGLAVESLLAEARVSRPAEVRGLGPVLLGGLGFSGRVPGPASEWAPFGAASLVLPELTLFQTPAGAWLTGSVIAEGDAGGSKATPLDATWSRLEARAAALAALASIPADQIPPPDAPLATESEHPTPDHWRHVVGLMAGAVGRGRLDKVVFARRADMVSPVDLDVPAALRRLAASAPESTVFAFRRGPVVFMGATPERLVRTDGRTYRTAAIAGSMRRGADAAEDAALAAELLASEKEREEHAVVVRAIRRQLAPVSELIRVAPEPGILALRHVQHLVTEVSGTLKVRQGLLALAELLHPTPAVGGEPRDLALAMIDEHEGFERGWYSGPVGWLSVDGDGNGDGEMMVALRCGLVRGNRVSLFAGCGIVADSDPDREWEESRIKMRAVAAALGRAGDEP
jgi:isochorismate synthase